MTRPPPDRQIEDGKRDRQLGSSLFAICHPEPEAGVTYAVKDLARSHAMLTYSRLQARTRSLDKLGLISSTVFLLSS